MSVIDLILGQFVGELSAESGNPGGFRFGHLAHHVDVMHPAIDDRRDRGEQAFVSIPILAVGLLVQIHPHDQGFSKSLGDFNELDPTRMLAKNVANHQGLVLTSGKLDEFTTLLGAFGKWFLREYVTPRFQSHFGKGVVGVRVGRYADRIRLQV